MSIRKCEKCGAENRDSAKHCSECGSAIIKFKSKSENSSDYIEIPINRIWIGLLSGFALGAVMISSEFASKVTIWCCKDWSRWPMKVRPTIDYYLICLSIIIAYSFLGGCIGWLWQRKYDSREEVEDYIKIFPPKKSKLD